MYNRTKQSSRGDPRSVTSLCTSFVLLCTILFSIGSGRSLVVASQDSGLHHPPQQTQPLSNQILITDNGFAPSILTTTVNLPVTWLNNTGSTHVLRSGEFQRLFLPAVERNGGPQTDRADSAPLSIEANVTSDQLFRVTLAAGERFSFTFTSTGVYPFSLEAAPYFTGKVVIEPGGSTLPPDPSTVAPPLDPTTGTSLRDASSFLYTGNNPIQTGVIAGTMEITRAAVLRGKVTSGDGAPLPGVRVTILGHPEFGQTLSRADGFFDIAVNGGGQLTVRYAMDGFLPVQRAVNAPWRDYAWLPEVILLPYDSAVTQIDLGAAGMQVAQGSEVSDSDGARQATIFFPPNTTARQILSGGRSAPLATMGVRITEFTVGEDGPDAMPAQLPPSSGYTYAAEFSVDEAVAAGAVDVQFNQPLPVFVENFLDFPVGGAVPAGYYDREKGQWVASANGRVIAILSVNGGLAELDIDGSGNPANADALTALGVTNEERAHLAQLYIPGQSLWRVPVSHFTPWDFNWPYGPPDDAEPPPGGDEDNDFKPDDPNEECGSVIGCENQTIGESLPIAGTPWRLQYQSDRTPGRKDANSLVIPVSGPTIPASLQAMRVEVHIAGQIYRQSFAPAPNRVYTVTWDGKDGYGRPVQGAQPALIHVHFDYAPQYYAARTDFANSFARSEAFGLAVSGSRQSATFTLSKTWIETVRSWDAPALGFGGWSLSIQHTYDPAGQTVWLGGGRQRSSSALAVSDIIFPMAGNGDGGNFGSSGDGGPATSANMTPVDIAYGPDGALYIADRSNGRIRRVGTNGIITSVASGFSDPTGIAVGSDGALYVADNGNNRIRRVGTDGIITNVAGNGQSGYNGDNIPALSASLWGLGGLDVAPDGTLYFVEWGSNRVRRVGTDGIITTVAGNGTICCVAEGGLATEAGLLTPKDVAVGRDGSLYIAVSPLGQNDSVYHVGGDGRIHTVAGGGTFVNHQDGISALEATLESAESVAVGDDGRLYIADAQRSRVRRVMNGIITTVAGNGISSFSGDFGPAKAAGLVYPSGLALDPEGNLLIVDGVSRRIRWVGSALLNVAVSDILLPSSDGSVIFVFDSSGRHLKTLEAMTGALRYQFGYDAEGYLVSVTDADGNVTTIERVGAKPTAIVAPGGQRTTMTVNNNGWLSGLTNPAGESHTMSYSADGLLQQLVDPLARVHTFTYDGLGRLVKDEDPVGGSTTLSRVEGSNGYTVTTTTALGRNRLYSVETLPTGAIRRSVTEPSGVRTTTLINTDGSERITYADGTVVTVEYGPDPRWGMLAPVAVKTTTVTPGGRTRTITRQRSVTLATLGDLLSLAKLTQTVSDNGAVSTFVYDGLSRILTSTTAAGRVSTATVDAKGRVTQREMAGIAPASFVYDNRGLLSALSTGSGAGGRTTNLTYNNVRYLTAVQDPLGRTTALSYDEIGRPLLQTLPDGRTVGFAYDANGNLSTLTPPNRPAHSFGYTEIDLPAHYTPPDVNPGSDRTQFSYNSDGRLAQTTRPDGQTISAGYDGVGRLNGVTIARGTVGYAYHPTSGQVAAVNAPDGVNLTYSYDGWLLTGKNWTGPVAGSVGYVYDNRFRLTSTSVNGGAAVAFQYADDSLLTQAGALALSRNAQNGLLTGSALGGVTDGWGYNSFAEPISYSASYNAAPLFSIQYQRDKLGRITRKSETIGGATNVYTYTYDLAGRLTSVGKNGLVAESYTYDANSNRLSASGTGGVVAGVYDAQDRLTQYGTTTYGHSAAGERISKTSGGQTTQYNYDALGNLLGVTMPNGTTVAYLVDGQNQRIGKRVNGVLVQGFLYENNLRPAAELNGSGGVVSRFVYATRLNVPDYLVKEGVTYRILTDHLGSPRLVVNTASGAIAQRMDYDSFGNVLTDTNPGFQPFGFAGGLYDAQTKLVRFGARDYDPQTGRWSAKDPLLFMPGETNLYAYASNDPMNRIDPDGLWGTARGVTVGLGFLTGGSISAGWGFDTSHGFFLYYSAGLGPHAGISAGCGLEATFFKDFDQFYGKGFEAGVNAPIGGLSLSGGDSLNAISISLGPSIGGDVHVYSTYTATTKSTDPAEDLPPAADGSGSGGSSGGEGGFSGGDGGFSRGEGGGGSCQEEPVCR
ncbi:MAG: hypothetical protein KF893_21995 [Caldilineaceae bacterium]|nr:hypothetical protein [Caldilineaceae bacterium]